MGIIQRIQDYQAAKKNYEDAAAKPFDLGNRPNTPDFQYLAPHQCTHAKEDGCYIFIGAIPVWQSGWKKCEHFYNCNQSRCPHKCEYDAAYQRHQNTLEYIWKEQSEYDENKKQFKAHLELLKQIKDEKWRAIFR